ncbi:MAG: hypothetical protein ABR575_03680 [Actinomycetota bacterium]
MTARAMPVIVVGAAVALAGAACFREAGPGVTEKGLGIPVLSIDFPASVAPGSVQDAKLTITNPGPGEMTSVLVAFSALGDPSLPAAIVGLGRKQANPAVVNVSPDPTAVSPDGVVYVFGRLGAEETTTITFRLRMPDRTGPAANAIQVYEGEDIDRARGIALRTVVEE